MKKKVFYLLLLIMLAVNGLTARGQTCPHTCTGLSTSTFTAPGCPGSTVLLDPSLTGSVESPTYVWSGPLSFTSTNTLITSVTVPSVTTVCTLGVTGLCSNLICDGTFPDIDVASCFTHTYDLEVAPDDPEDEGDISVTNSTSVLGGCPATGDHTTGDNMLIVNGSTVTSDIFWQQNVAICPSTDYVFRYWAKSLNLTTSTADQPHIVVSFDGNFDPIVIKPAQPIGPLTGICGGWQQYTQTWSSGANTSVVIRMSDACSVAIGNDFAVDDITFQPLVTMPFLVTVNPVTVSIHGPFVVCSTKTATITGAPGGGVWTSGDPGVVTIDATTGVATGVAEGTATITYTITTSGVSCFTTANITVKPQPSIDGIAVVCAGETISLSGSPVSGTWSSFGGGSGSITFTPTGPGSVDVTGVSAPAAGITYTKDGCTATKIVTVNSPAAPITGTLNVCVTYTVGLSSSPGGGTWSSSTPGIATVGLGGIVTGIAPGTSIITYDPGNGCAISTAVVTVDSLPDPIVGPAYLCPYGTAYYSSPWTGTWGVSSGAVISSVGVATAVATSGTATISYTLPTGCYVTKIVTLAPAPAAISGPTSICIGDIATLSSATGGGVWNNGSPTIATLTTGTPASTATVLGLASGTTLIAYGNPITNCATSIVMTVNPNPAPITGTFSVCAGATTVLSCATPAGTWTISPTTVATISSTGVVTGVAGVSPASTATVTYTLGTGCKATAIVTVHPLPNAIFGSAGVCFGETTALTNTTAGGTWSSSNPGVAPISATGVVTGLALGTSIISYTLPTGCATSVIVTVNPLPGPIYGNFEICQYTTVTLFDDTPGGVWSSPDDPTIVSVGAATGDVYGGDDGIATIIYTLPTTCSVTVIVTVNPAPTITSSSTTDVICVGETLTLTGSPSGGTWFTTDPTIATIDLYSGVVTGVSAGIVSLRYRLPNDCEASWTVTVIDPKSRCVCEYRADGHYFEPLGASGTIGTSPAPGYYYIDNNVEISGSIDFTNCVMVMAHNVTIKVPSGQKLTLENSHLFSCDDMWVGIQLITDLPGGAGTGPTGQLEIRGNGQGTTLIEDAHTAVDIQSPIEMAAFTSSSGSTAELILYSHGAVLNKNICGIRISNYSPTSTSIDAFTATPESPHPSYPFRIENTVITCRDLSTYSTGPSDWPFVWPAADASFAGGLKAYSAPPATAPYDAPYLLQVAYTPTVCNGGTPAHYGIDLAKVGTTTGLPGLEDYKGIVIGGEYAPSLIEPNMNLFDNLGYGIYAKNSNVVSRNNAFNRMRSTARVGGGIAIYSFRNAAGAALSELYKLDVYGRPASGGVQYNNKFWDCITDVHASDLYNVRGIYSDMSSRHSSSDMTDPLGSYGYRVVTSNHRNIMLLENDITNITTGISYTFTPPVGGTTYMGQVSIKDNDINASSAAGGVPTTYGEYVTTGVAAQTLLSVFPGYAEDAQTNVDDNEIYEAFNGIVVTGYTHDLRITTSNDNIIKLRQDLVTGTAGSTPQAGIWHGANLRTYIQNNEITGPGYNVPTPTTIYTPPMIEGVHGLAISGYMDGSVTCNTVKDVTAGFYFGGVNAVGWWQNIMENNSYGFVMADRIGWQPGSFSTYPATLTATEVTGNKWKATAPGFSWIGSNYQMYTTGSTTLGFYAGSPMAVDNTDPEQSPINNQHEGTLPLYTYSYGGPMPLPEGLFGIGGLSAATCTPPVPSAVVDDPMFRPAVQQQMGYTIQAAEKNWIAQLITYKRTKDTVFDSSAVLHAFKIRAANSRFQWIQNIEDAIVADNYTHASCMLNYPIDSFSNNDSCSFTGVKMADGSGADGVATNYVQYYKLLIKYQRDTLDSGDSTALTVLASKCPDIDGPVIYNARGLYNLIFGNSRNFSDIGCNGNQQQQAQEQQEERKANSKENRADADVIKNEQQYVLSPNPSNGNITLRQSVPDSKNVKADVLNAAGISIYRGDLHFTEGYTTMRVMNATPGLYLLKLTDGKARMFIIKFTIL